MAAQIEPVQRRLVSGAVYDSLLSDVLAGRLAPGDALPSERTRNEAFAEERRALLDIAEMRYG